MEGLSRWDLTTCTSKKRNGAVVGAAVVVMRGNLPGGCWGRAAAGCGGFRGLRGLSRGGGGASRCGWAGRSGRPWLRAVPPLHPG
ncbi:hypothetical protein Scani_53340 [Streptomyces caniferus]|uniref:Uncharacterized protein n=1 Tax=Streptomyces caniferus TaxID=285557 RepID=A0A640SF37_9ACTN|nr:hypothetical protein Scani_53340 [Streptomyces caniferus]